MSDYDDIIDMPHWEPRRHARMPLSARAAQFAPFAALTGHNDAIRETARLTCSPDALLGADADALNRKMNLLLGSIAMRPRVEVMYFEPDQRKEGGAYVSHRGIVKKYDECGNRIVFADGVAVPVAHILDLRGEIFEKLETDYLLGNDL